MIQGVKEILNHSERMKHRTPPQTSILFYPWNAPRRQGIHLLPDILHVTHNLTVLLVFRPVGFVHCLGAVLEQLLDFDLHLEMLLANKSTPQSGQSLVDVFLVEYRVSVLVLRIVETGNVFRFHFFPMAFNESALFTSPSLKRHGITYRFFATRSVCVASVLATSVSWKYFQVTICLFMYFKAVSQLAALMAVGNLPS